MGTLSRQSATNTAMMGWSLLALSLLVLTSCTPLHDTQNTTSDLHAKHIYRHHLSQTVVHQHSHSHRHTQRERDALIHSSTATAVVTTTATATATETETERDRLHIVFVYTVVPAVCAHGLPEYIQITLQHTVRTQPDCTVVMASNYGDCEHTRRQVETIPGVRLVDTAAVMSNRTALFLNLSANIFASDHQNELWMTSALRFLNLEDIFHHLNLSEALHVEADNLVYGRVSALRPFFRKHYPLAVTPLNSAKMFMTASVFWISSMDALRHFVDFFLEIATNEQQRWTQYLRWLRPYACCKPGGVEPDPQGMGIKPFAINEMSLMSYYHELYPERLRLLPVIPFFSGFFPRRNFGGNLNDFRPGSLETHFLVPGRGIWDPNSWGQYLGGTSRKRGRDRGFIDGSHIAGQAILGMQCKPAMLCAAYALNNTQTVPVQRDRLNEMTISLPTSTQFCVTAPYVRCGDGGEWTPLWNLHVHSKNTMAFQSQPCNCSSAAVVEFFPTL